jgi:4-amino-4-deoxy-L-arabinose transferase-like glycosyltransferase
MQLILYRSVAISPDEGYFAFMGNSILNGSIPYVDFADNKPPGIWYLLSLGFLVFGKSIYVAREITYVAHALSAFVLYLIGKKLWNEKIGMISALLFLIGILIPAFEGFYALTEPFLTLFSLLGFLLFVKGREQKLFLLASGAAIGISTLFKQTGILLLFAIIIFYLCNLWIPVNRKKEYLTASAESIFLLLCGFIVPILIVVSYFWSVHALIPLTQYVIFGLKEYGTQLNISALGYKFLSFSIIWFLSSVSLLTIGYKFIKKSSNWETLLAIWLLLSLCPLVSRQYGHYFIQILPPACLLASVQMVNIIRRPLVQNKESLRKHDTTHLLVLVCTVILVVITVVFSSYSYITSDKSLTLQSQIRTAEYIRSHTIKSDKILVYPYVNLVNG